MIKLFSPAKLNLFFRVIKKRPDGFHEISSLIQAISLGDELTISVGEGKDTLYCNAPSVPTDHSNLVLRAAELFRKKTGLNSHFSFVLDKKIPIQAGLGGGSSNAATTLWGLNQILSAGLSKATLAEWGAELGSDVPFFFSRGRAYCEGRGDIIKEAGADSTDRLWVAKPKEGLSTPAVYGQVKLYPARGIPSHSPHSTYFNDLEDAAFRLLPKLKIIKESLLSLGFDQVHMTGSGTAFFCLGKGPKVPHLPEIDFYPVQYLYREDESWYKFPH